MIYLAHIPGFSKYGISLDGDIYSIKGRVLRKVSILFDKDGYARAMLTDDSGKRRYAAVHRIVYSAFKGDLIKDETIDHIDGNRLNNHWNNLEQVTFSENIRRSFSRRKGKMLDANEVSKVFKLRQSGLSQMKISEIIGINQGSISLILQGKAYKEHIC